MAVTKNKLTVNALTSIIQVIFTAILYFFLYKYLLNQLGIKLLGVWSLILSFSSIANLANLGLTSGLVKFVAEYIAEKNELKLGKLIFTATISLAVLFIFVSLILFVLGYYFLHLVIDPQFLNIAMQILPFSLCSLCLNAVSGVFTSVLEGHQKNYLRNYIYIGSGILMFIFTILLTPIYQLRGMAMAQIIQAVFIFFAALFLVQKINYFNRFRYWQWSKSSLKELFSYGIKFQIVSVTQMLYEPTTKMLLSKFGGLSILGHYEMASRMVNQFRAMLVSANQVVIPVVAEKAKTSTQENLRLFYEKMNRIMLLVTLPLTTLLIVCTPLISILWIGSFNYEFVIAVYVLAVSSLINIMCGPSYFSCLGEGHLNILVLVHAAMAVINIILGIALGYFVGGYGIIFAWGIALALGSIALIIAYSKMKSIKYLNLFGKNEFWLTMVGFTVVILCILCFTIPILFFNYWITTIIFLICFLLLLLPILWKNRTFKLILNFKKQ
jgi:O-antigen/teichoic acid export membrane protein